MRFTPRQSLCWLLALAATCSDPDLSDQSPGSLALEIRTAGEDQDLDGYRLRVDDTIHEAVSITWRQVIEDLVPGRHEVELLGVADNCTVLRGQRQDVSIAPAKVAGFLFDVTCFATGIEVFAPQTGLDLSSTVTAVVDGTPVTFGASASGRVTRLAPGPHEVSLTGVAPNCTLDSPPGIKQVQVRLRQVTAVQFPLTCVSTQAVIIVTATTTGVDTDLDGYRVRVNQTRRRLAANLDPWILWSAGGDGTVEIDDIAGNCSVVGTPVRDIQPLVGSAVRRDTVRVFFDITCGERWGFAMMRNGLVTLSSPDGQDTYTLREGNSPTWSPDGRTLAYECSNALCVTRMDGSTVAGPDRAAEHEWYPAWMPDGRLSFVGYKCEWYCYVLVLTGLHMVSLEPGGGARVVQFPEYVAHASDLAWSRDGSWVAFTCDLGDRVEVCRMHVTGGVDQLTSSPGKASWGPSWSPDGQRIVFATTMYGDQAELAVLEPDRTIRRLNPAVHGQDPFWLSNGNRIVFAGGGGLDRGLYMVNPDGTGLVRLTSGPDYAPAWRR